jgi:ADP-heptose:LPS heptosyltransferase
MRAPINRTRVLFVRHWAYGDVLLAIPVVRAYRRTHPQAEIHFYTWLPDALGGISLIDKIVDARCVRLADVEKDYADVFFLRYEDHRRLAIVDGYAVSTGIESGDEKLEVAIGPSFSAAAKKLLAGLTSNVLIGIQPRSGSVSKDYPLERFQELVDRINANYRDASIVVLCDRRLELRNCLNLSGCIPDVRVASAVVGRCDFFISVDAGLLHVAQALGIPTVGLFGPTSPELVVTDAERLIAVRCEQLQCLGCFHELHAGQESTWTCRRGDLACMKQLPVETVYAAFVQLQLQAPQTSLARRKSEYRTFREAYRATLDLPAERTRIAAAYRQQIDRITRRPRWVEAIGSVARALAIRLGGPQTGLRVLRWMKHREG